MARVLVVGSNSGIGLGVCAAYAERGDEVIAACRRSSPELEQMGAKVVDGIELTSSEAVAKLADAVGDGGLDVLVYNAAVNSDSPGLEDIDLEQIQYMLDVNATGAVRVVLALLPKLNRGAKIMFVGIGAQALNGLMIPTHSKGNYGYRMSKAALTSFASGLARDLRDRDIAVVIGSPGAVNTPLLQRVFDEGRTPLDPQEAADPYKIGKLFQERIDELTVEDSPVWQARPTGERVDLPATLAAH